MTANEYKAARLAMGLTQGQLAECLGVTRCTINGREAGRKPISREVEYALAYLCDCSIIPRSRYIKSFIAAEEIAAVDQSPSSSLA